MPRKKLLSFIIGLFIILALGTVWYIGTQKNDVSTPPNESAYTDEETPVAIYRRFGNVALESFFEGDNYHITSHLLDTPDTTFPVLELLITDIQDHLPEIVFDADDSSGRFAVIYFGPIDDGVSGTIAQLFQIRSDTGQALAGPRITDLPITWFSGANTAMTPVSGTDPTLDGHILRFTSFPDFDGAFTDGKQDGSAVASTVSFRDYFFSPLIITDRHGVFIYPDEEEQEVENTFTIHEIRDNADSVLISMTTVSGNGHQCSLSDAEFFLDETEPHTFTYTDAEATQPLRMRIQNNQITLHDTEDNYYYHNYCGMHGSIEGTLFDLPDWIISTASIK